MDRPRLLVVSNCLAVIARVSDGNVCLSDAGGGLATGCSHDLIDRIPIDKNHQDVRRIMRELVSGARAQSPTALKAGLACEGGTRNMADGIDDASDSER